LVWAASVALVDLGLIGAMLRWRLPARLVFVLAAANPVEAARMALLSGADAELASLGPVGLYLAVHVGPGALFVLGTAWPALVGAVAFAVALRAFRRGDLV